MEIENKSSIIRIQFDGFLSCLIIQKPKVADWPDYEGTTARYYACLPEDLQDLEYKKSIDDKISSIRSIDDFLKSGFLDFLESGKYTFELWKDKPTEILYNSTILNSNKTYFRLFQDKIGNTRIAKPFGLNSFYPYGRQLLFSQPFESLNPKRIEYYEEIIKKGIKPLAIAIRILEAPQEDEESYQNTFNNTTKYVLDGHHKLIAYANLKINPSYIIINRISPAKDKSSALPNLSEYLYHSQIENIITNGLPAIRYKSNISGFVDNYIRNATSIEDTLVSNLYRYATYNDMTSNDEIQQWYKDRLQVLIDKTNEDKEDSLILDYYCSNDYCRKYIQIESWNQVKKIVLEKL